MKVLALGFCLLCTLLVSMSVYRMVEHDTEKTQTDAFSLFTESPKMLPQPTSGSEITLPAGTVVSVTLADPIDSDHASFGRQYAVTCTGKLRQNSLEISACVIRFVPD
jgi:hypothetical protein